MDTGTKFPGSLLKRVSGSGTLDTLRLFRTRFVYLHRCYLLFTGIFLVAIIAGATASYTSGLHTKDFFLGEAENILVITGPGSTPVTSQVPEHLVYNLGLIDGVTAVSPEILAVGLVNNHQDQLVIIRGVDPVIFDAIEKPRIVSGNWFASVPGGDFTGALAGSSIASLLHLSPGDEMVISSTLDDTTLVTTVTGIIETGTAIDDEIILPRISAKLLSNTGPDSTTLIRVAFDNSTTSKTTINSLVNSVFTVPVRVITSKGFPVDPFPGSLVVNVYSYNDELVDSALVTGGVETTFALPFGLYYFTASFNPPLPGSITYNVTQFVNRTYSAPLSLFLDPPPGDAASTVTTAVTAGGIPLPGQPVDLTSVFSGSTIAATSNATGHVTFTVPQNHLYYLNTTRNGLSWNTTFFATGEQFFSIEIGNDLVFSILDASTQQPFGNEVNISVSLREDSGAFTPFISDLPVSNTSRETLALTPGVLLLELDSALYHRNYTITQHFTAERTFYLGNGTLSVLVSDSTGTALDSVNITASLVENPPCVTTVFTNASGMALLELSSGNDYRISLEKGSFNNSFQYFFDHAASFTAFLRQSYPLQVNVYDGSSPAHQGISSIGLDLSDGVNVLSRTTGDNGSVVFHLPDENPRELTIHQGIYTHHLNVSVRDTPVIDIPLGAARFNITVLTPGGYPLTNAPVALYNTTAGNDDLHASGTTGPGGLCSLAIPARYGEASSIRIEAAFNGSTRSWITSFNSSRYGEHAFYFDYYSPPVIFQFTNNLGKPVDDLFVTLTPVYSGFDFTGLTVSTNATGHAVFQDINLGYYILAYYWEGFQSQQVLIGEASSAPFILFSSVLEIPATEAEKVDPGGLIVNKWPGNREYLVTDSAGYAGAFFETSLSIVALTFFCFVVIISSVSFLIVSSIVAFPVHQQASELRILRAVGASGNQVATALALQFSAIAVLSSVAGVVTGHLLVISIAELGTANLAGILLSPRFDLFYTAIIVTCACLTVFYRTFTEVHRVLRGGII